MDEWFVIPDLEAFTDKARGIVYNNFGKWHDSSELDDMMDDVKDSDQKDLDKLLSHDESLLIIKEIAKKQTHKYTNETRYTINDKLFLDIIDQLNSRMVSNVLNSLVNKGLVESSYDAEVGDFVFWIKDENQDKPETD